MMQGEKVAADIKDALVISPGDSAILPMLSPIARRCSGAPQAPELIEPSVKALDEAMEALELAAQAVEARCAPATSIRANWSDARSGCSRFAAWRASTRRRSTPCRRWRKNTRTNSPISARASRASSRSKAEARAASAAYAEAAARCRTRARRRARELERAVNAELPPLKLERARFSVEITRDDDVSPPTATTAWSSACRPIPARGRGR